MLVRNIKVSNFKSFRHIDVNLGRLNVIVGANASGKSNFVDVFRFLNGLTGDRVGGSKLRPEYLRNVKLGASEALRLTVESDQTYEGRSAWASNTERIGIKTFGTKYSYAFNGAGSSQFEEELSHEVTLSRAKASDAAGGGEDWHGRISIQSNAGMLTYSPEVLPIETRIKTESIFEPFFTTDIGKGHEFLIGNPLYFFMQGFLDRIGIYNIDPTECQNADPTAYGTTDIQEDGDNLAVALRAILDDRERKRKLYNLLAELLPFVSDVQVEKSSDDIFLLNLEEIYARRHHLPAYVLSAGTLSLMAHLVVLYFMEDSLVVIEEPDRHMHPFLASRLANILDDVSSSKQVIITTHNPEIVRHVRPSDILLLSRDPDGFSVVTKPADDEEVQQFLKNDLGMAELYLQDLLGG